jgi:hypothetical protein
METNHHLWSDTNAKTKITDLCTHENSSSTAMGNIITQNDLLRENVGQIRY